jgi:hypothetical protein
MNAAIQLRNDRVQLQLAERIVTMAESGGQKTPVTRCWLRCLLKAPFAALSKVATWMTCRKKCRKYSSIIFVD